jgi:hypothetical protein
MHISTRRTLYAFALAAAGSSALVAQQLPTTQPGLLTIYREHVKTGQSAAHAKHEAGWPAAYAQANSPDHYLAMASMTGPSEVWFVQPWDSYTTWGKSMVRDDANPTLTEALSRLSAADAQYLDGGELIEARARPDLSHGTFPDLNRMRFWDIAIWRLRPGYESAFAAATATYKKVASRAAPNARWRTYQVTAGLPGPTFILFSSVEQFGQFDAMMTEDQAAMQAITPEEGAIFEKFFREAIVSMVSNRFRLDAGMSYVSAETKATDPAFWNKK